MAFIEKITKIDEYDNVVGFNQTVHFSWTTQMVGIGEHEGMKGDPVTRSAVPGYVNLAGNYVKTDFTEFPEAIQSRIQEHWVDGLHEHYKNHLAPKLTPEEVPTEPLDDGEKE